MFTRSNCPVKNGFDAKSTTFNNKAKNLRESEKHHAVSGCADPCNYPDYTFVIKFN